MLSAPESWLNSASVASRFGLVFKDLKSRYRIGELPTRKAPVAEAFFLSSIVIFLLSWLVLDAVRRRLCRLRLCHRVPQDRRVSLFDTDSVHILTLPARTTRAFARCLEPMLLH